LRCQISTPVKREIPILDLDLSRPASERLKAHSVPPTRPNGRFQLKESWVAKTKRECDKMKMNPALPILSGFYTSSVMNIQPTGKKTGLNNIVRLFDEPCQSSPGKKQGKYVSGLRNDKKEEKIGPGTNMHGLASIWHTNLQCGRRDGGQIVP
jgi:hypothetical protein